MKVKASISIYFFILNNSVIINTLDSMEKDLELYSESKRNLETVNVFVYDKVPDKFKNNIYYFIQDQLNYVELSRIYRDIIREHGLKRNIDMSYLNRPDIYTESFIQGFEKLIDSQDNIDFL